MAPFIFVDRISNGLPIKVFGNGLSSRDYTYISDIVNGIIACIDVPRRNEVFNLGNSSPITLQDFIALIEDAIGKSAVKEFYPEQPGDMKRTYACLHKARKLLGYQPKVSLEEGIGKLVEWYRQENSHIHALPPTPPLSEHEDNS